MEGDPVPAGRPTRAVVAIASAAAVVAGLAVAAVLVGSGPDGERSSPSSSTTTATTVLPVPPPGAPSTSPPPGPVGRLAVDEAEVALGATAANGAFTLRNVGDAPLVWTASPVGRFIAVAPGSGTLPPGGTARVGVVLDRLDAPEGPLDQVVAVDAGDAGAVQVPVRGAVARPPIAGNPTVALPTIRVVGCTDPVSTAVSVTVTDDSGVAAAVLRWDGPGAIGTGEAPMVVADDRATGTLGPFAGAGEVTWYVVVTDTLGTTGESPRAVVTVEACPAPG
jgi:hypothetical protein